LRLAITWFCVLLLAVSATAQAPLDSVYEVEKCEVSSGQAEQIYREELRIEPAEVEPLGIICAADAFEKQGDLVRSEELLERALARSESLDNVELVSASLRELGQLYARLGRAAETHSVWDRLVKLDQGSRELLLVAPYVMKLANEQFASGHYEESLSLVLRVREYAGEDFGTVRYHGDWIPILFEKTGRTDEAERIYRGRVALARGDDNPAVLAWELGRYAEFLRSSGRIEEAHVVDEEAEANIRRLDAMRRANSTH
jgi:tetratricopeptide (TPR) repeat protein